MVALSSSFGFVFSSDPTKPIGTVPKTREIRLASQSSCFIQFRKQGLYKSVPELVLQKARKSRKGLQFCRSVLEIEGVSHGDDSENEIRRKKLAVFVSGGGSNFRSIHEATARGLVHGDIVVLVTDKPAFAGSAARSTTLWSYLVGLVPSCGGAEYARDNGIPVILFPKSTSSPGGLSTVNLVTALRSFEVDYLLLAGYLKLIPVELVQAYPKSILNIHPSLLPAFGGKGFYGMKVHKAVIASGARYSGPTIHFVDEHYDTGRILAQRVVPVLANDTADQLAARVLHEEHQIYVEAVAALCEERILWREDGIPLIRSRENPNEYS